MSSAYWLNLTQNRHMTSPSGVMISEKSSRSSTDPCGTPVSELSVVDVALPTLVEHERPSRYDFVQPKAGSLTPNVCPSTWWSMVSKVLMLIHVYTFYCRCVLNAFVY